MDEGCKNDRELETQGSDNLKVEDSLSMEWTDEKHSLYLNSMEASFVDLLYRNKYHLKDLHGLPSRTRKHTNSLGVDAKTVSSGQFKVLRRGCWEKLNFEKAAESHNDTESEAHLLSANPWIQHFRPSSIGKELHVPSYNLMDVNDSSTQPINLSNQNNERAATSSMQFPCFSRICHQDSVGCCTEVSDQNFVDQEPEGGKKLSITGRKKKAKTAATKEPFKDQVVPLGKLHIGSTCEENHSRLK
ncbi:hypothetical protein J5N97_017964 [Dioscorea zingiberensis]|uniref:Uncharacterized protein n=1 Tax=Dioscorea zingiberensis TaxID=325984 RepID=A0A9D5CNF3_9LILI|nr:hypothetical protein J5N97_017964 [Dioscorea zingiberensis]